MRLRRSVALVAGLALASIASAGAAAASGPGAVPFRGSVVTIDEPMAAPTDCPAGSAWRYVSAGAGTLAHLGATEISVTHCSQLTGPTTGTFGTAEIVLTAANGDTLTMEHEGQFVLGGPAGGPPETSTIDLEWTITGGTGRFLGATGSGTGHGVADLINGITPITYDGTITYAASSRSGR